MMSFTNSISTSEHIRNPGIFVRVASIDTEHLGFDREDIPFPSEKNLLLSAMPLIGIRKKSGKAINISTDDVSPLDFRERDNNEEIKHFWVSPHGIPHRVKDGAIECVLPIVSELQEIWFTHFEIVNGVRHPPNIVRVVVEP